MTKDYFRLKIREFLFSRKVADPNIRLRALERVFKYMEQAGGLIKNEEVILPSDRKKLTEILTKVKGGEVRGSEDHIIKLMYDYYNSPFKTMNDVGNEPQIITSQTKKQEGNPPSNIIDIENKLIKGGFLTVNELENGVKVPPVPGLYCIKLRKGIFFSKDYGKIREDGIIYIGKSESSLRERLWDQELNHKKAATFFRSIGAMLGKRPPKGSLYGGTSKNFEFDYMDTEEIKKWMRQSLLVNFVPVPKNSIKSIESKLIEKYCPLVNIQGNPQKSKSLMDVRKECNDIAHMEP